MQQDKTDSQPALIPMSYPPELPISQHAPDIVDLLVHNQVVVVAGETGSGKSTQLPKIALQAAQIRGVAHKQLVGHTQPRRIAARAVSERVADEMHTSIGQRVAYTVRFNDTVGKDTEIKVMTDGILLAELQRDRTLRKYHTIIVDEAHERSLNIDFILGYLKQLLAKRRDLRIIITSATIDTQRFREHFANAKGKLPPLVEVSGRTYPVEIRYRPLDEPLDFEDEDDLDDQDDVRDVTQGIVAACQELVAQGPGDILVFAAGERAIADAAEALEGLNLPHTEILPLFARLSAQEQHRVFNPHQNRRIIIATNIAETSITVPGIKYVVDPGFARISRYGRKSKVQRLPVEKISQASANQRSGRCGRIGPGVAIRLYSEESFANRPEFTEPEILRTNLASVILQMLSLGLRDIEGFPFIEPPERRAITDGIQNLVALGAIASPKTARPQFVKPAKVEDSALSELYSKLDTKPGITVSRLTTTKPTPSVQESVERKASDTPRQEANGKTGNAGNESGLASNQQSDVASNQRCELGSNQESIPGSHKKGKKGANGKARKGSRQQVQPSDREEKEHLNLTGVGATLAKLPIDPRLARIIFEASQRQVIDEAIVCTAALTLRDVREYPADKREHATQMHSRFNDPSSDFLTTIALWNYLQEKQEELSGNKFRKLCQSEFIHYLRYREWKELVRQLSDSTGTLKLRKGRKPPTKVLQEHKSDELHKALLSGMIAGLGVKKVSKEAKGRASEYQGIRGSSFMIGRRSSTAKFAPDWIMAGEVVETVGFWAGEVAKINPDWIEEVAQPVLTYSYSEPKWKAGRGQAVISETVSYQGLTIVRQRDKNLRSFDRNLAREIFIEDGLVADDLPVKIMTPEIRRIQQHNQELITEALEAETRLRSYGRFDAQSNLQAFLARALPPFVCTMQDLSKWIRHGTKPLQARSGESQAAFRQRQANAAKSREGRLKASLSAIMGEDSSQVGRGFPDTITVKNHTLTVTYTFDPSEPEADGMTVHIPLGILPDFEPKDFQWLVPGFRADYIATVIKSAPKEYRRMLSPLSETAETIANEISPDQGDFFSVIGQAITRRVGKIVTGNEIAQIELPAYLQPRFSVYTTTNGKVEVVAFSSNLKALQTGVTAQLRTAVKSIGKELERDNVASISDIGELPTTIEHNIDGHMVTGYPAVVPSQDRKSFRIRIMPTARTQQSGMLAAYIQALNVHCQNPLKAVSNSLSTNDKMQLMQSPYANTQALVDDMMHVVLNNLILRAGGLSWSGAGYDKIATYVQSNWRVELVTFGRLVVQILKRAAEVKHELAKPGPRQLVTAPKTAVAKRLGRLVYPGFISKTPLASLLDYPRYLQSLTIRLQALPQSSTKDVDRDFILTELADELAIVKIRQTVEPAEIAQISWLLEELHVSLFAQHLGTKETVSESKLRNRIRKLRDQ